MSLRLSFAAVAAIFIPTLSPAAEPTSRAKADAELARTAQGMFADLKTITLENGLRIYLLPVKNSPTVTTMVAYRVGSADEEKDQTGLSHYLEHLMFKGTDKLLPGDVDRATQRNGGHNNAYTSEDMTVYHFDFAADRWQSALAIEADRMRNIRIDAKHEFEQEKGNVISELQRNENRPWDLEQKRILELLFPKDSPYSHPVIGDEKHVRSATAEIIKRHYDKWYYPNNASLVIVGGFDADQAMAKIKQLFSAIEPGELPKRKPPTLHKDREGPVRTKFESTFSVPRVMIGFNTIAVGDPDDPVLDVISNVLGDGRTSRLYRKMVEDERIASDVSAGNYTGRYPGWFGLFAELLPGKNPGTAEEMLFVELAKLGAAPISDEEFERARRKILARFVFSRESVHSLADAIARASTYPGGQDVAKYYRDYLTRLSAITKADVQRVAKKFLDRKQASVVWSIPKEDAKKGMTGGGTGILACADLQTQARMPVPPKGTAFPVEPNRVSGRVAADAGSGSFSLAAAKRVVLPNGLVLVMLEDHRLPVIVASLAIKDVSLYEPADKPGIAEFVGGLLEEGTTKHTGQEIAALIEDTGGSMSLSSAGGGLHVLTPDTDLGLGLFFECLIHPNFPADAMARQREQQLASIDEAETQPEVRAANLFKSIVYGKHPNGRVSNGKKEVVAKLTAEDCKQYHDSVIAPNHAILALVGDFNSADMAKKIEALTRDWQPSRLQKPPLPAAPPKSVLLEQIVSDPTAKQVHMYLGHLGISRNNPDYYKLLVMDNVLGTGPGFTDRLSSTLRDRRGLAYTVYATITMGAGSERGAFTGYINPANKDFLAARDGFVAEIVKICEAPPTAQEVDDAKKYLLGSLPFKFTSMSAVAGQLVAAEKFGLGFNFLEKYRKEVEAVTPADVHAVAQKYLNPKALTIIAVGPIDKEGKPLEKKPQK